MYSQWLNNFIYLILGNLKIKEITATLIVSFYFLLETMQAHLNVQVEVSSTLDHSRQQENLRLVNRKAGRRSQDRK